MLKKYLKIAALSWQEIFAYRANFILETIGLLVFVVTVIFLWLNVYANQAGTIGGYTRAEMITHLVGAGIIIAFIMLRGHETQINDDIRRGDFSGTLVRPINPIGWWTASHLAARAFTALFGVIFFSLVIVALRGIMEPPAGLFAILFFAVSLAIGLAIHMFLFFLLSIIAFWVQQAYGFIFLLLVAMELGIGALVPLTVFPAGVQTVLQVLPFKFMVDVPMRFLLGKIDLSQAPVLLGVGLAWLLGLVVMFYIVYRRGIRRYEAAGR